LIPNPAADFVIDGLRWKEDVQFFKNLYPATCIHVHLTASKQIRKERFERREKDVSFEEADGHEVEQGVAELAGFADIVFDNSTDDEARLWAFLESALERLPDAR
jgi:dephospho-CoA kinase